MNIREHIKRRKGNALILIFVYLLGFYFVILASSNLFVNFNQNKSAEIVKNGFETQKEQFYSQVMSYVNSASEVIITRIEVPKGADDMINELPSGDNSTKHNLLYIKSKNFEDAHYHELCPYSTIVTVFPTEGGLTLKKQESVYNKATNTCVDKHANQTDYPYTQFKLLTEFSVLPIHEVCSTPDNSNTINCHNVKNLIDILLTNELITYGKLNVNKSKRGVYLGENTQVTIK